VIEIWSAGTLATGSAGANYFRTGVKFGSTVVVPYSGQWITNSQSIGWSLVGRIICVAAGTSGAVEAQGFTQYEGATDSTHQTSTVTIDTTAAQTLSMFLQDNITATGNSMTMRQLIVKLSK
jgi:hypothetical protein